MLVNTNWIKYVVAFWIGFSKCSFTDAQQIQIVKEVATCYQAVITASITGKSSEPKYSFDWLLRIENIDAQIATITWSNGSLQYNIPREYANKFTFLNSSLENILKNQYNSTVVFSLDKSIKYQIILSYGSSYVRSSFISKIRCRIPPNLPIFCEDNECICDSSAVMQCSGSQDISGVCSAEGKLVFPSACTKDDLPFAFKASLVVIGGLLLLVTILFCIYQRKYYRKTKKKKEKFEGRNYYSKSDGSHYKTEISDWYQKGSSIVDPYEFENNGKSVKNKSKKVNIKEKEFGTNRIKRVMRKNNSGKNQQRATDNSEQDYVYVEAATDVLNINKQGRFNDDSSVSESDWVEASKKKSSKSGGIKSQNSPTNIKKINGHLRRASLVGSTDERRGSYRRGSISSQPLRERILSKELDIVEANKLARELTEAAKLAKELVKAKAIDLEQSQKPTSRKSSRERRKSSQDRRSSTTPPMQL